MTGVSSSPHFSFSSPIRVWWFTSAGRPTWLLVHAFRHNSKQALNINHRNTCPHQRALLERGQVLVWPVAMPPTGSARGAPGAHIPPIHGITQTSSSTKEWGEAGFASVPGRGQGRTYSPCEVVLHAAGGHERQADGAWYGGPHVVLAQLLLHTCMEAGDQASQSCIKHQTLGIMQQDLLVGLDLHGFSCTSGVVA